MFLFQILNLFNCTIFLFDFLDDQTEVQEAGDDVDRFLLELFKKQMETDYTSRLQENVDLSPVSRLITKRRAHRNRDRDEGFFEMDYDLDLARGAHHSRRHSRKRHFQFHDNGNKRIDRGGWGGSYGKK